MTEYTDNMKAADDMHHYGFAIVAIAGGFVLVGDVIRSGGEILISRSATLRSWGTTKGLGELYEGPTKKTELDPEGEVIAPYGQVLKIIPVSDSWDKHLTK